MIEKVLFSSGTLAPERLVEAERSLGVTLPDDFRSFMLRFNGGRPKPSGFDIVWQNGQRPASDWKTSTISVIYPVDAPPEESLLHMNSVTFAGRIPADTLAIGSDSGGNVLLLALGGPLEGRVLFWCKDHEVEEGRTPDYDNVGLVADSFQDLLERRLRKPR